MLNTLGVFMILFLYLMSGINKIGHFESTSILLNSKHGFNMFPLIVSKISVFITILLLIPGSLILLYSSYTNTYKKISKYTTLALIGFTVLATALFHNPIEDPSQKIAMMKNISIIGGLVLIYNSRC